MNGRGRLCGSAPGVRENFPPDFPPPLGLPPRHHRTVPRPGGSGAWARPRSEVSHSASGYCSPSVPLPPAEGPQHRGEASVSSPAVRTEAADLFLPLQHLPFRRKGQPLCFAPSHGEERGAATDPRKYIRTPWNRPARMRQSGGRRRSRRLGCDISPDILGGLLGYGKKLRQAPNTGAGLALFSPCGRVQGVRTAHEGKQ